MILKHEPLLMITTQKIKFPIKDFFVAKCAVSCGFYQIY